MYRQLALEKTCDTIAVLQNRIYERFPDSGLYQVCCELHDIADETRHNLEIIQRPNYWLRSGVAFVIFLAVCLFVYGAFSLEFEIGTSHFVEFIQIVEAGLNDLILIGAAVFFLITLEARWKRTKTLRALNELRAVAHVIDMHQLTKDPTDRTAGKATKASPVQTMSRFELGRYLDYCSEMLSLTSKLAAVYGQSIPDPEVIGVVNEIESLTTGLSRKIWQKIMILDQLKNN